MFAEVDVIINKHVNTIAGYFGYFLNISSLND